MKYTKFFYYGGLCVLAAFFLLPQAALAINVSPDELAVMEMFFDDSQLFETATRSPKPLNQVAENVIIITAEQIEAMEVHNLDEVLSRVAGIDMAFLGREIGSVNIMTIHESRDEGVLVLIDGVRRNSTSSGNAKLFHIPLQIINRVEVIKGPASSAWGSTLGGVINIITKDTGNKLRPEVNVAATYGEADTRDYNVDLAGRFHRLGYYLYAGRQETDGLKYDRFLENDRFYGKVSLEFSRDAVLTASFGHSAPGYKVGEFPDPWLEFYALAKDRSNFASANLALAISDTINMNIGLRYFSRDFVDYRRWLANGPNITGVAYGDLFWKQNWEEISTGANLHMTWTPNEQHSVAVGAELNRGILDRQTDYGAWAQANWWAPVVDVGMTARQEVSGLYVSDTIRLGRLTVIPGIRYDHHSIADDLVSPSIGATFQVNGHTLLRADIARGFIHPTLSYIDGNDTWAWGHNTNPDLAPIKVNSFQLGLESILPDSVHVRVNLFQHEMEDDWEWDPATVTYVNSISSSRKGYEIGARTMPLYDVSISANFTQTFLEGLSMGGSRIDKEESYVGNLTLVYDNNRLLRAELYGRYVYINGSEVAGLDSKHGNFTWDLLLSKKMTVSEVPVKVFAAVHNLTDAGQYWTKNYANPDRWFEAGVRFSF